MPESEMASSASDHDARFSIDGLTGSATLPKYAELSCCFYRLPSEKRGANQWAAGVKMHV